MIKRLNFDGGYSNGYRPRNQTRMNLDQAKQHVPPICDAVRSYYLDIQTPIKLKENTLC